MTEWTSVLYIHSHDTGRYVQPYGFGARTPHLQSLAEQGVLFRNNHCVCPTCSPSRAALLTGTYPHENGMMGLAHRGWQLWEPSTHLAATLSSHGFHSVLSGVQHETRHHSSGDREFWQLLGYSEYLGSAERAEEQAAEFLSTAPAEPFFLSCGFVETHREFPELEADDPENPAYTVGPGPLPDTPETREDMARFNKSARILDAKIGRVLEALESSGLAKRTLVICTTDHGIAFPRMKCNLEDSGTGTMLIVRGPGGFDGGKTIDAMTSHLDIFPTICEICGVSPPEHLRGASLFPLVRGETDTVHDALFSDLTFHASYEPMRAIRTERYKYIRRFGDRQRPVLPNCDDGLSKSRWLESGWRNEENAPETLYDLVFDPNETRNLAELPRVARIRTDLAARLEQWMRDTQDPLLDGPVLPPAGAMVTWPDATGPREQIMRVDAQEAEQKRRVT